MIFPPVFNKERRAKRLAVSHLRLQMCVFVNSFNAHALRFYVTHSAYQPFKTLCDLKKRKQQFNDKI